MKKIFNWQNFIIFLCLYVWLAFIVNSDFGGSFAYQIFITAAMFLYVAIFYISRKFIFKNYSRPKKYFIFMTSLILYAWIISVGFGFFTDRPIFIAKTSNVAKAKEIKNKSKYIDIIFDAPNDMYYVKYNNQRDVDEFKIDLALDYLYDNDVKIEHGYYYFFGCPAPTSKRYSADQAKYLTKLLKKVYPITDAKVDVKRTEKETIITVDAEYFGGYTEKEIRNIITKLNSDEDNNKVIINLNQKEEKIENVYYRYKDNAYVACKYNEYNDALEVMNDAKAKLPKKYEKEIQADIKDINKMIELNKKIEKQPNNYKLYIERGHLEYEKPGMFSFKVVANGEKAFADYQKALELNPKAYDLYENLGDILYYSYPYRKASPIIYYAKAITYDKTNSCVYRKMGNLFYKNRNYKKALEYYQKSLQYQKDKTILEDGGIGYYRNNIHWYDIYSDIYLTQKKLRLYDDAMETCYERLAITTNNPHEKEIKEEINKEIKKNYYFGKPYYINKHIKIYPQRFNIFFLITLLFQI